MIAEPQLAARAVRPLLSGLRVLGHDPAPLLGHVGLEETALADPDARIPMRAAVGLLAHAVERTGDPDLGLHLAEHAELSSFDVFIYTIISSPTLRAGYERLCRYQRLIHDTSQVELEETGDGAILRHRMPGGLAVPRQSAEFIVACWVRAGRVAAGQEWSPIEVRFAHPEPPGPSAARDHERYFRAPVRFGAGMNALLLSTSLLDTPCQRADPALLAVLDRHAADRLASAPGSPAGGFAGVADQARAALAQGLEEGPPTAAQLAARLRMSERTLSRALAAEGTSYREVLEQLRKERAANLLSGERLAIAEIAFLLGFSELSAFHRAFKRWTGKTPAQYRAGCRSGAGARSGTR